VITAEQAVVALVSEIYLSFSFLVTLLSSSDTENPLKLPTQVSLVTHSKAVSGQ
jgi:hypothetical protein